MEVVRRRFEAFRLAAVVAASIAIGGTRAADAADLGGDCCADLEERIAELEATAVRKGNRKVSVTITGYVTKQIMFWDDGTDRTPTSRTSARRRRRTSV
jgi:hypothetical protein